MSATQPPLPLTARGLNTDSQSLLEQMTKGATAGLIRGILAGARAGFSVAAGMRFALSFEFQTVAEDMLRGHAALRAARRLLHHNDLGRRLAEGLAFVEGLEVVAVLEAEVFGRLVDLHN